MICRKLLRFSLLLCSLHSSCTNDGGSTKDTRNANIHVTQSGRDDNIALGNPSTAGKSPENYLVQRTQYSLSYNKTKKTANWVSWHLSSSWKGPAKRCNCFEADKSLPANFPRANASDYRGSGFDKGHLCPSDDRDGSTEDNAATFVMSNIAPQAPNLNRDVWEKLERYSRSLLAEGNELYIIAGAYGTGGEGEKGTKTRLRGNINVPARFWKVIVVIPEGSNDINRIQENSRIIAVDMPNQQSVNIYTWGHYRTSVDAIEKATGCDLLSALPVTLQNKLEALTDDGPLN